jgi:hypothetical protein
MGHEKYLDQIKVCMGHEKYLGQIKLWYGMPGREALIGLAARIAQETHECIMRASALGVAKGLNWRHALNLYYSIKKGCKSGRP